MGFFSNLFGGDPAKDLDKAQRLLADGEARRALELAQRSHDSGRLTDTAAAASVIAAARQEVTRQALEKAATAEASEYWGDAAEWLQEALEVAEPAQRQALADRRTELIEKQRKADLEPELDLSAYSGGEETLPNDEDFAPEDLFATLTDMFTDRVAEQYSAQSGAFEKAFLAFHEGDFARARELYELLVEDDPENTVARLERGRCRLHDGEPEAARDDFETVWPELGNEPLDRAGQMSIPGLWADAQLAMGEPEPILDRLTELARPSAGRAEVVLPYAQALVITEAFDDAESFLRGALGSFGSIPELPWLYAGVLTRLDRADDAIHCLEAAIAPSCATGNCRQPPLHLPSVRALIGLKLQQGDDLDRARALFELLAQRTQGRLVAEDQRLLADYYQKTGNLEAAEEALAQAGAATP